MPNLESFSAIAWKLPEELYDEPIPMLNLHQLAKLKISKFDKPTIEFFSNFLPSNSIDQLNLQGDPEDFLISQKNVTKLELHVDSFDYNVLSLMKLTELKLKLRRYNDDNNQSIIRNIFDNQPNLTHLDIVACEGCFDGDETAFASVCNLKALETLKLNIDDLSSSAFMEHFNKLSNLKSLEVESVEHNFGPVVTIIDELSHQEMIQLTELNIYLIDVGVPLDRIERMGRKFKSLKSFNVRCDHPLPLDCYLTNMKQLNSLCIDYHYTKEFAKLCNNFDFKSSELKQLSMQGFSFGSDDVNWNEINLLKLADALPNLEKLELDATFPFNTAFIMRIMEKLPKLHTIKNWSMIHSGDNHKRFDHQSVFNLKHIASMLNQFSLELRLKVIDMDVSRVKEDLSKNFNIAITSVGNFIVIRLVKK